MKWAVLGGRDCNPMSWPGCSSSELPLTGPKWVRHREVGGDRLHFMPGGKRWGLLNNWQGQREGGPGEDTVGECLSLPVQAARCQPWPWEVLAHTGLGRLQSLPSSCARNALTKQPADVEHFCFTYFYFLIIIIFIYFYFFVNATVILDARPPLTLPQKSLQQEEIWGCSQRLRTFYKAACFIF